MDMDCSEGRRDMVFGVGILWLYLLPLAFAGIRINPQLTSDLRLLGSEGEKDSPIEHPWISLLLSSQVKARTDGAGRLRAGIGVNGFSICLRAHLICLTTIYFVSKLYPALMA